MSTDSFSNTKFNNTVFGNTTFEEVSVPKLQRWAWSDLGHWLRLLWPALLVSVAGFVFFPDAIVKTIVATPHPALVYAIFGTCLVAILVAMALLHQYLQEAKYAQRWMKMTPSMRYTALKTEGRRSVFMPVYRLLSDKKSIAASSRQAAVSAELEAGEIALEHQLELPNFLGGALVGMGLIGTFIGLLGTLEDLSKVFSALVNSNSTTMSPTQMFSDMVAKLQAPMQGMGTAFVASLYGLLGSLIVSLMMVSVRKTASSSLQQVYKLVRELGYGAAAHTGFVSSTVMERAEGLDHMEPIRLVNTLQTAVNEISKQVMLQQAQQEDTSRESMRLIQELVAIGRSTAASQNRTEEALLTQLAALRTVLTQERDNQSAALQGTRLDMHQLIRSIEECQASFAQSAQNMSALLAQQDSRLELMYSNSH
jgi:MotA/TolQ/ExbB proton channel family